MADKVVFYFQWVKKMVLLIYDVWFFQWIPDKAPGAVTKIESPNQFAPIGANPKELKAKFYQVRIGRCFTSFWEEVVSNTALAGIYGS